MSLLKKKSISILTPVFNRDYCIGRCIESVIAQKQLPHEFVLLDDGSTDNTKRIIDKYIDNNSFIKVLKNPINLGIIKARNKLIENSTGEFVLWLDSDDWLKPDALEIITKTINTNSYSHYLFPVDTRLKEFDSHSLLSKHNVEVTFEHWLSEVVTGDFVHVVRRESFQNIQFIDDPYMLEGLTWLKVIKKEKKMLFANDCVLCIEKNRRDKRSLNNRLNNLVTIDQCHNYLKYLYNLFNEDYRIYFPKKLERILIKNILLGIALRKINENIFYLKELKKLGNIRLTIFAAVLRLINRVQFSTTIYHLIKMKSDYNSFVRGHIIEKYLHK